MTNFYTKFIKHNIFDLIYFFKFYVITKTVDFSNFFHFAILNYHYSQITNLLSLHMINDYIFQYVIPLIYIYYY